MRLTEQELLAKARTLLPVPAGATHVAVRKDGSKLEFGWASGADVMDEPPRHGQWGTAFKEAYWRLFPLPMVHPAGYLTEADAESAAQLTARVAELPWLDPHTEVPAGGWKAQTYYRVCVELYNGNVAHDAILFTGFLDDDVRPGGYGCILSPFYDQSTALLSQHPGLRLKVIAELFSDAKMFAAIPSAPR